MRHCNSKCSINELIGHGGDCPILSFKKTRKQSDWYFMLDGKKLIPLCEEKNSKTTTKKGLMTL